MMNDEEDHRIILGRIDERVKALQSAVARVEAECVKLIRFLPVERLVFGLVAVVLLAVATGMMALVLRR